MAAAKAAAAEFRDVSASCIDVPLQAAIAAGHVSFVHQVRGGGRASSCWLRWVGALVVSQRGSVASNQIHTRCPILQDKSQAVATAEASGQDAAAAAQPEGQQQQQQQQQQAEAEAAEEDATAQEDVGGRSQPGFGEGSSDLELEDEDCC